jgi:extracellular elastinolytic metalloproteinase
MSVLLSVGLCTPLTSILANIASSKPSIPVEQAIPKAEQSLEGKYNDHPPTMEYLAKADGSVALTHVVQIQNDQAGTWYEAFVDAHSGELLSVTDFVAEASVTDLIVGYYGLVLIILP